MFKQKVAIITGASRGIGREMALHLAQEGASVALLAKTSEPHPTLPGTIHTVAAEIEQLGAKALAIQVDVRDDIAVQNAINKIMQVFGKINILINNASAISLTSTLNTPMKRFDLLFDVNARATFACSQACIPYLLKAENPHILTLSPPLNMNPKWFKDHLAYTLSKYGMSMCTLGLAEEFKEQGLAVNSLWPKTTIATSAIAVNFPQEILNASRKPSIVAEAALHILRKESKTTTGNFFIDEEVLRANGVTDFSRYALNPQSPLYPDLFL